MTNEINPNDGIVEETVQRTVQRTVQVPVERVVREQVNPVVAQAVEPVSHWSKWWWLPLLLLGLLGALLWHGCHTASVVANTTETVHNTITETITAQAETETIHEGVTETVTIEGHVTEAQAREIAVGHVGTGEATAAEATTEHGAVYVVTVHHDGTDTRVYVADDGSVAHSE